MKKTVFLLLFLSFSICSFSQDIITTKENERIEVKVLEINETNIKYVLFYFQDGPTYLINKSKVKSINFQNGLVENFDYEDNENNKQSNIDVEEQKPEKIFKHIFMVNPVSTIMGAILGAFDIDFHYAYYFASKVAVPVEFEFFTGRWYGTGFSLLSGIEAVPVTHRQKSGLLVNALAGVTMLDRVGAAFVINPNVGYQIVTRKGFAFNFALGPMYGTLTKKINIRFMANFGGAF